MQSVNQNRISITHVHALARHTYTNNTSFTHTHMTHKCKQIHHLQYDFVHYTLYVR